MTYNNYGNKKEFTIYKKTMYYMTETSGLQISYPDNEYIYIYIYIYISPLYFSIPQTYRFISTIIIHKCKGRLGSK